MIKILTKNYKGLTLMETIINIFVYVIVVMICMTVAMTYIKSRIAIRQQQQAVEELSMTMNDMAKKIRMSSCPTDGGCTGPCESDGKCSEISVAPNSGGGLTYKIDGTSLKDASSGGQLIMENIGGWFKVTNAGTDEIPLVQIHFWRLKKGSTTEKIPGTDIQTSVSMRSGYSN